MIELLILIVGVVALWKFGQVIAGFATGVQTKTEVWTETIVKDATLERADNYAKWKEESKDKEIVSHETFMEEMKGN